MNFILFIAAALFSAFNISLCASIRLPFQAHKLFLAKAPAQLSQENEVTAAMLPGNPVVTGTLTQGVVNAISLYNNVLLARIALSWFPQLVNQFPILRPIFLVTEPYLKVFRSTIPPIVGFDLSALPAFFILDILSQTTAVVGVEIPPGFRSKQQGRSIHLRGLAKDRKDESCKK